MLLALVMVVSMATGTFAAESGTDASAALELDVAQGTDTAVVSVYLTGCNGVTNGRFSVSYDTAALSLTNAVVSNAYAVGSVNDHTKGTVTLAWVGSQLTADETLMLTLNFKVISDADQVTYSAESLGIYANGTKVDVSAVTAAVSTNPFVDIDGHWAEDDIVKAYNAGLFAGVTDTLFVPDGTITRAMFVSVLYRMAGSPAVDRSVLTFQDLKAGAYYVDAVAWGVKTGVVSGLSSKQFAPDKSITRQEMMAMLYRYAKNIDDRDVSKTADLSVFTDNGNIAAWAKESMSWALAEKLLAGYPNGTVQPTATATRAQAASILCRYLGIS